MFRRNINTNRKRPNSSEDIFILSMLHTNNLQTNDTTSYNGSLIVLCCLTRRPRSLTRRLIFVTRRLVFVTHRLVFVTRRLVFVTRRLVFVTRRVQKCSYVKFSKSPIFVSPSETPTGILFPQSIHLCKIGVLSMVRNSLCSRF